MTQNLAIALNCAVSAYGQADDALIATREAMTRQEVPPVGEPGDLLREVEVDMLAARTLLWQARERLERVGRMQMEPTP